MDIIQRLIEKHERARVQIAELLTQADEALEAGEQERADELEKQAEAAHAEAMDLQERISKIRNRGDLERYQVVRRDTSLGNDTSINTPGKMPQSATRDMTPPTPEEIIARDSVASMLERGYPLTEEQTILATRVYPVEQLWGRVMVERSGMTAQQGMTDLLTSEERSAYRTYQQNMERAIEMRALSNPLTPATTAQGSEFVPTVLARQIFAELQFVGPLAGDALPNVFRLDYFGNLDIPKVTSTAKAAVLATGTDITPTQVATGKVTFTPHKYSYGVSVNYELLVGDYLNLMTFLSSYMSEGYGVAFNQDRTVGDGANKIAGAFNATLGASTPRTASKTALADADVIKLYDALATKYYGRPNVRIMFTGTTEMKILSLRDGTGGNRIFPLNPSNGRAVLYRNVQYMINEDLDDFATAGNKRVMAIGDFSRYGVFYAGGLRAGSEYQAVSDQILLTMHWLTDGKRLDDDAFKIVATPS